MESTAIKERSTIDEVCFQFVQDLASALSRGDPIDIPSFPDIALRVKDVLEDETSTSERISRVVGSEPGLAARLLKMANSAALNRTGQQVVDLKIAINRLGQDQVRASATSLAMKNLMDSRTVEELQPFLSNLWKHSIHVAAVAYSLGQRTAGVSPDEAMFVGLVHDIGKLYILTRLENYPELCASPQTIDHIIDDWHTSIGKAILENWKFPDNVLVAIDLHENTDHHAYGEPDLTDVIIVANLIANSTGDNAMEIDYENVASCKRMGINAESIIELNRESAAEINELMSALRG